MDNLKRIESLKKQIAKKERELNELMEQDVRAGHNIYRLQANWGYSENDSVIKNLNLKYSKVARQIEKRSETLNKLRAELRSLTQG